MKIDNGEFLKGDCLELMKNIPDCSVDMVITDPPYTMTSTGNSCRPNYMPGGEILNGMVPDAEMWMKEVYRIMKDSTHFYTFCNKNDIQWYLNTASDVGFRFHNIVNVIKDTKMPNRWYMKYTEPVLFFYKGKAKAINDKTSRDYFNVIMPKKGEKIHPTQKPLDIIEKFITNSTNISDVILDPFSGSGTTAIAAINTNRKWICMEMDETYYAKATERVKNHIPPTNEKSDGLFDF